MKSFYRAVLVAAALPMGVAHADPSPDAAPPMQERFDPAIELPEGEGKRTVLAACTRCHTLEGVQSYKGYWSRPQWLEMVKSMVENGAVLNAEQVQTVTDYLTANFGRDTQN